VTGNNSLPYCRIATCVGHTCRDTTSVKKRMQTLCAGFPVLSPPARSSGLGIRPSAMEGDEGQGRYDFPASFAQAEGREPKAGHRAILELQESDGRE
jgi:hypothetical protein